MTKTIRQLGALALVLAMMLSLCSCGISESKAVGTWSGTYTYNGNEFTRVFTLDSDNTYSEISYKNGELYETEVGTWEVDGGRVELHPNGDEGTTTAYQYKGKALVNNKHRFYKI